MDKGQKTEFIVNTIYYALVFILTVFAVKTLFFYLFPFVFGFFLAYFSRKAGKKLSKKMRFNEKQCSLVFLVFVFLAVSVLLFVFCSVFSKYGKTTLYEMGDYVKKIYKMGEGLLSSVKTNSAIYKTAKDGIKGFANKAVGGISSFIAGTAGKIPSFLLGVFVAVLSSVYITRDYDKLVKFFSCLIPEEKYKKLIKIKKVTGETFRGFMGGYLKLFLITFVELTLGFLILKVSNPIVLAFLISTVDILPVLGVGTVLIPWAIISFVNKNIPFAVGLTVLYGIITVIRNFSEPKIIGKQFNINPIFTLLFMFIGYKTGGIAGVLILPFCIIVYINYYVNEYYSNKN